MSPTSSSRRSAGLLVGVPSCSVGGAGSMPASSTGAQATPRSFIDTASAGEQTILSPVSPWPSLVPATPRHALHTLRLGFFPSSSSQWDTAHRCPSAPGPTLRESTPTSPPPTPLFLLLGPVFVLSLSLSCPRRVATTSAMDSSILSSFAVCRNACWMSRDCALECMTSTGRNKVFTCAGTPPA